MTIEDDFDLTNLNQKDYSLLGLKHNPFPSTTIPNESHIVTADRKLILESFRDLLSNVVLRGDGSIVPITGEYGTGKTHLLLFFKGQVNSQLSQRAETKALAIYVQSVGKGFKDIYDTFITDLGRARLHDVVLSFVYPYFKKNFRNFENRTAILDKWSNELQEENSWFRTDLILRQINYVKFFEQIRATIPLVGNSDLIYALLHLIHPDYSSLAWRWLVAEELSKQERDAIKVTRNIKSDGDALSTMTDMILLLRKVIGYNGIVVLLDEVESILSSPKKIRDSFLKDLRHFIDNNKEGVLLMLSFTPSAYAELLAFHSPLTRLIQSSDFQLKKFNLEDTKELIGKYLRTARKLEHDSSDLSIEPFTNDAVNTIHSDAEGMPGEIIKQCQKIIEYAQRDEVSRIDGSYVKSVEGIH